MREHLGSLNCFKDWPAIQGFKEGSHMIVLVFYRYDFGNREAWKEMKRLLG